MHPAAREFERDSFLAKQVGFLIAKHSIASVIETGTEYGGTTNAFARLVPKVYTMDIEQKFDDGDLLPNVEFFKGDSRVKIVSAIVKADWPILFYLDAHSSIESDEGPLLDELEAIANLRVLTTKGCVVVVHDCQVPGLSELGYDSYGGQPISLELAKPGLEKIYPRGWSYFYNTHATGAKRGVLFVEPK